MRIWTGFVLMAASAMAQEAPAGMWAHLDFVLPTAGKAAEYHAAIKEKVVPKIQERLRSGDEYALVSYARMFPHHHGEPGTVRLLLSRKLKGAARNVTAGAGFPPGLFHTTQGELWRLRHSVDLDKFLASPVVRVLFLKPKEGKTSADTIEIYKSSVPAARGAMGLVIFDRTFTSVEGAREIVVMWGYASTEPLDTMYERLGQQSAQEKLDLARLRDAREFLRQELWTRRADESVVPNQ